MSRYKSVTGEKTYLRKFAGGYVVQVPAPGNGLGQRLNHMLDFCRDRFGADHTLWGAFGSSFYFLDRSAAVEFRKEFADLKPHEIKRV
jgi:hypothetical protein